MKQSFNKFMRVTLSDGRVIVGRFYCLDREASIVLKDCENYEPNIDVLTAETPGQTAKRSLGPVLVPGRHVVKCELQQ